MAVPYKYQAKEVLNKVLNSGEDALKVDIDNVTLDGSQLSVDIDKENDSIVIFSNTAADGSGTNTVPLVDAAGHLQIDIISSALPSGGATAANQSTIIGHVDGIETLITSSNTKLDTLETTLSNIETAVQIIDDWDDSNYANVNINLDGSDAPTGGGGESGALRVTIANDSTGVVSVDDGGGAITVDNGGTFAVQSTLQAGSATIGKLAANSGVDIGDVDVTSLPASTNTIEVVGDVAENENAAGNPVLVGGRYDSPGDDNASLRTLGDTDVGALALDPTGAVYVREALGQAGSCFVSGTSAVTAAYGKFVAIQFLEDTVFNSSNGLVATDTGRWPDDSAAASDVSSSNTAAVGSQVFPQGMTIFGRMYNVIFNKYTSFYSDSSSTSCKRYVELYKS
mgnify:CR=1 FL=1